jgi:predicted MFS family arabinose efflux permease
MDKGIRRASALAMAMMFLVQAANFLDRNVLGMLLPQIRAEFHLSDGAMGFLVGPPFVLVYTLLGLPLAVLTDRGHRRRIVALSLTVFSLMTALCAAATSFPQLSCSPASVWVWAKRASHRAWPRWWRIASPPAAAPAPCP